LFFVPFEKFVKKTHSIVVSRELIVVSQ